MKLSILTLGDRRIPVTNQSDAVRTAANMIRHADALGLCPGLIQIETHLLEKVSPSQCIVSLMRGELDGLLNRTELATPNTPVVELGEPLEVSIIGRIEADGTVMASGCRLPAKLNEKLPGAAAVEQAEEEAEAAFDETVAEAKVEAQVDDEAVKSNQRKADAEKLAAQKKRFAEKQAELAAKPATAAEPAAAAAPAAAPAAIPGTTSAGRAVAPGAALPGIAKPVAQPAKAPAQPGAVPPTQ